MYYLLKTTVCTSSGPAAESSTVFPAAAAVGTSSPAVPGTEDEVGACLRNVSHCVCICMCFQEREKRKYLICEV